jgi:hypothetical protein
MSRMNGPPEDGPYDERGAGGRAVHRFLHVFVKTPAPFEIQPPAIHAAS